MKPAKLVRLSAGFSNWRKENTFFQFFIYCERVVAEAFTRSPDAHICWKSGKGLFLGQSIPMRICRTSEKHQQGNSTYPLWRLGA